MDYWTSNLKAFTVENSKQYIVILEIHKWNMHKFKYLTHVKLIKLFMFKGVNLSYASKYESMIIIFCLNYHWLTCKLFGRLFGTTYTYWAYNRLCFNFSIQFVVFKAEYILPYENLNVYLQCIHIYLSDISICFGKFIMLTNLNSMFTY